jgi:hypothetical protein
VRSSHRQRLISKNQKLIDQSRQCIESIQQQPAVALRPSALHSLLQHCRILRSNWNRK